MIKKIKNIITFIILIFFLIIMLTNPNILTKSVYYSINLFIKYIFPALFPFFLLSDILINYSFTYYIGKVFNKFFSFIFNIGEEESFVFILSFISGQPSNAKYIKDLLDKKIISINNANVLLSYTIIPSPMFTISTVGYFFYNSFRIGLIILISIYLSNIFYGIIIRNKYERIKNKKRKNKPVNLAKLLNTSIITSFNTLFIILGSIIIFIIIVNTFDYFFNSTFVNTLLSSVLEITIGSKNISVLNLNINIKILLTTFILTFGGLSVHMQIKSILCDYNIKYSFIIFRKIIISFISTIICYVLINIC